MKNTLFMLMMLCVIATSAQKKLPFQGKLLDNNVPFTGTVTIDFSIPTASWTESHSGVVAQDGFYSVVLGENTPLPEDLFAMVGEVELSITVDGEALSDVTLYSPMRANASSSGVSIDTLSSKEIEVIGQGDNVKIQIGTSNAGYDSGIFLYDSLNQLGAFIQTDRATGTGGYFQLSGRDYADGSLKSAVAMGTIAQTRQNSFIQAYGGNFLNNGPQLLVNIYGTDIDQNDLQNPTGYRRGGIDLTNYYGLPTHNIFSFEDGSNNITSAINLSGSAGAISPVSTVFLSSGDIAGSGGFLELNDMDGTNSVRLDGTGGGGLNLNNKAQLLGNLNGLNAGGLEVADDQDRLRIIADGLNGELSLLGPNENLNVVLTKGQDNFGSVDIYNDTGDRKGQFGIFSDQSGFLTLEGPTGRNIRLGSVGTDKDFGGLRVYGTDGATERARIGSTTDGFNEWGYITIQGPSGNVDIDGSNGQVLANILQSSDGTVQASDRRLKKDIHPLENALTNVMALEGVSYHWKDESKSKGLQIGVIAQDLEEVYPAFVHTGKDGLKAVNYAQMTAVLIEAIKELNSEVEFLKNENELLKEETAKIEHLEGELEQIKSVLGL